MSKVKKRWITIISLFAALFLILGLAFGLPKESAFANTYAPSSIFSAGTNGTVESGKESDEAEAKSYIQFTFSDGGKVHYRRDLALKWFSKEEGEDSASAKYFSMKFSFGDINFEKFTIDFESSEENISKDGKTTNSILFEKGEEDKLNVYVNKSEDKKEEARDNPVSVAANEDITIAFDETGCKIGEFRVLVKEQEAGKFENIGGYFMEYRSSSSSTPNTPMTFTATLPADAASDARQKLFMKSLNGQSFELNDGKVNDDTPAVLVLNESLYAFKLGQKFSLSYEAIDVCDDSVTVTREYYMLKTVDGVNRLPNETELKDEEGENGKKYSSYNYQSLTTSTYLLPSQDQQVDEINPTEFVSIRFKLNDDTKENDTYVYLSWYAAKDATESVTGTACKEVSEDEGDDAKKTVQENTEAKLDFIKVNRVKEKPVYTYLTVDGENKTNVKTNENNEYDTAVKAYEEELKTAAEETSAGTGAYIYLPSLRGLISSNDAGYRNLKFSIYYYKEGSSSASSQTSLSYNGLKIEVDKEGWYKFRVLAQDASGNAMEYYSKDKELVTVTGSNIWEIDGIPEFTFEISYKGPTVEKTEEQSLGYRNDTYNFSSFDIVALPGYQTKYTLYRYVGANVPGEITEKPSSYSDFVSNLNKENKDGEETYFDIFKRHDDGVTEKDKKILYEIGTFDNDVDENDAKWDRTDNEYYWDPDSSLSFVPQEAGFYILELFVEDGNQLGKTTTAYQVIEVRNPIDTIPGQSQWLEENVVSVVLFAISGVLAIIVVVLFLVKPSDKKVEEVDLEKLKGKKKAKSGKKK